ncbi:ribonuclease HII [Iodobacter fluviatilis]|uniref:Ribonuclease HII n=1 Tax=Iodobacter fluviatilis TaxID=537 RepID=A0A377Q8N6_9NEIS|nr:ribonuclease HII [Iodobacter fluviatilis]TCU88677.1 RNase HII [Iodobacter fluviatilis]STQ91252.1 Ribonuclease HII [Iodobacter fluviatilis]
MSLICGVDEAGRGPLAGAVFAAAVILPARYDLPGLNDSKKLTARRRDVLFDLIKSCAVSWSVASASIEEIDELNILHATMLAMQRAVAGLDVQPAEALIDGNRVPKGLIVPARAIVGGDALEGCISAASILAKVSRDREVDGFDALYPGYGFTQHKGYPTAQHLEALKRLGPCPVHRKSFGPVIRANAQASLW